LVFSYLLLVIRYWVLVMRKVDAFSDEMLLWEEGFRCQQVEVRCAERRRFAGQHMIPGTLI